MLRQFKLTRPEEIQSMLNKLESELDGSKELKLFVRAHLLMTRMVLYPSKAPAIFTKTSKLCLKKTLRNLQLEIDTAIMLEMPSDFVSKNVEFEFPKLFKQMIAPYHGLLDVSVLNYLAEKLEIESELHTTANVTKTTAIIQKKISKKRKNPFNRTVTHDLDDALSLRSQISQVSKLSSESIASLFDKEPRRPSKILKIRRMQLSGAVKMS